VNAREAATDIGLARTVIVGEVDVDRPRMRAGHSVLSMSAVATTRRLKRLGSTTESTEDTEKRSALCSPCPPCEE
jgi:hypothetical protein